MLLGAVIDEIVGADAVHALAESAEPAPRQLLVDHRLVTKVAAGAAVLGAHVGAQKTHGTGLAPDLLADVLLLAPLALVRHHFRLDEASRRVAKYRELLVHPGRLVGARNRCVHVQFHRGSTAVSVPQSPASVVKMALLMGARSHIAGMGSHNPRARGLIGSAGAALAVLTFINLFNYLDRYVVSALVESLRRSELHLTDTEAGSLMSGFLIVFAVVGPIFGFLGDRRSRPRLIAFGVACWSVATALSGLAWNFASLFAARAAVGVGEAAYVTIGPSLLSDYFPRGERGRVMAIFFCAIPVGSALGYVVGGFMDVHFGWRMAFFVAGVPGLLLALLCLGLHDPPRGSQDDEETAQPPAASRPAANYLALLKNRPYALTIAGYAAYTFALGGLAYWMPAFLERIRHVPEKSATVSFGIIVVITGFVGTFAGGWLGDFCARYTQRAYLWISAAATLAAVPFAWLALTVAAQRTYLRLHGDRTALDVPVDRTDQRHDRQSRASRRSAPRRTRSASSAFTYWAMSLLRCSSG